MTQGAESKRLLNRRGWRVLRRSAATIADHPRTSLIVGVVSLFATLAGLALALWGSGTSTTPTSASDPATLDRQSSETPTPFLSSDASCDDFQNTAARIGGRLLLVDSPGRIGGGSGNVRSRVLPNGTFLPLTKVSVGNEVEVKTLLHNGNYTSADGVSVSALITADRGDCWRIVVMARVQSSPGDEPRLGPALILLRDGGPAALEYASGSTKLLDERSHIITADLPDGVTQGGISLPYAVPGGTAYFLSFRAGVKPSQRQSGQPS